MTILHHIGDSVRTALAAIPMIVVRGMFLALLVGLLVWVLRLPKEETTDLQPDGSSSGHDLRWGAALALGLQILIYLVL